MEKKYKNRKFILLGKLILGVKLIIVLLLKNPDNSKRSIIEPIGEINQKQKVLKAPSIEIPTMEPSLSNYKKVSPVKFRREKGIRNLQIKYILFQLENSLLGDEKKVDDPKNEKKSQTLKKDFQRKKEKVRSKLGRNFLKNLKKRKKTKGIHRFY